MTAFLTCNVCVQKRDAGVKHTFSIVPPEHHDFKVYDDNGSCMLNILEINSGLAHLRTKSRKWVRQRKTNTI